MDNFGQFIKRLRTEKKFNQTKLAAQLDLDTGALSKIETGKKRLNVKLLPKLAEIFELDIEKILIITYFVEKYKYSVLM